MPSTRSFSRRTPLEYRYRATHPLRTLFRLAEISWFHHAILTTVFIAKALPLYLSPLFMAEVIRMAGAPQETGAQRFWIICGGFFVLLGANIPINILHVRLISRRIRAMEHRLRAAIVRRLQHLAISFHTKAESGRLQAKMLRDVDLIVGLANQVFFNGISLVIAVIWSLAVVLVKDWRVAALFLVMAPISVWLVRAFGRRMAEGHRNFRREVETMAARASEMINLIPITRAHGVEHVEIQTLGNHLDQIQQRGLALDRTTGWFAACLWVTSQAATHGLVVIAGWMAFTGSMRVDEVVLYTSLFAMLVGNLTGIIYFTPTITAGFEAIRSVGELLECPDLELNEGKRPVDRVAGAIRFDQVTFAYDPARAPAVQEFSLDVPAGECVAFVGESGSGKSTLMSLTIGFFRPQRGRIWLDGLPMDELDMRMWRRHLAMVPQQTVLFSGTLRDNITYGLEEIDERQVQEAVDAANLRSLLKQLPEGLDTRVGQNGATLSGGQRQRVAIARALIRDPRVIIFDEATSALDVASEREVQEALERLIRGRTTFIVAHRLSTIRIAHRVVVMKDSRAVEIGDQSTLLARGGEFARLKRLQA